MPLKLIAIHKPSAESNTDMPRGEDKHKNTKKNTRHKPKHQNSNSPSPAHRRHHDTLSSNRPPAPRHPRPPLEGHQDPFSISDFIQDQMYTVVRSIPGIRWLTDTAAHPIIVAREKLSKFDGVVTARSNNTDGSWLYPEGNRNASKKSREIDIDSLKRSHKKKIKKERRKARKTSLEMRMPLTELRDMFVDKESESSGCSFDLAAASGSADKLFTIEDVNAGSCSSKRPYRPKNLVNLTPKCNSAQDALSSGVNLPTSDEFRFTPRLLRYESESSVVCNVASSFAYDQRSEEDSDDCLETHEEERKVDERRELRRCKESWNASRPEKRGGGSCASRLIGYKGSRFKPDVDFVGLNYASFASSKESIAERRYPKGRDAGLKFVRNNQDELNHRIARTSIRPLADEHVFETGRPIRKTCASAWTPEETTHNGLNDFSDENFLSMPKFVQVLPSSEVSNSTFLSLEERLSARKYEPKPRMPDEYEGLFVGQSNVSNKSAANEAYEVENVLEPMAKYIQVFPNSIGPQSEFVDLAERQSARKYEPKPRMQDEYEGLFVCQNDLSSVTGEACDTGTPPEEPMGEYIQVLPNGTGSQSQFYNLAELQSFDGRYEPETRMQNGFQCLFVGQNEGSLITKEPQGVEIVPSSVRDQLWSMASHPMFDEAEQTSSGIELYRNPSMQQGSVECIFGAQNDEVTASHEADVISEDDNLSEVLPVYRLPSARSESAIEAQDSMQLKTTCNIFQFSSASFNQAHISDEKCERFEQETLENESKNVVELNELRNRIFQLKHVANTDDEQEVKLGGNSVLDGNPGLCGNSDIEGKSDTQERNIDHEDLTEKITEDQVEQNENNENKLAETAFEYSKSDISEYSDNEDSHQELKRTPEFLGERPDLAEKLDRLHVELEQLDSDIDDLDIAINERFETDDTDDDAEMPEELGDNSGGCPVIWENSPVVENIGDVPSHNFRVLPQRNRWHDLHDNTMAPSTSKGTPQQKRRPREASQKHSRVSLANSLYDALVKHGASPHTLHKSSEKLADSTTQTDASNDESSWETASQASSSSKRSKAASTISKRSVKWDADSTEHRRPTTATPRTSVKTRSTANVRVRGKQNHVRIPEIAIESSDNEQATDGVSPPAETTSLPNANIGEVVVNETPQEVLLCERNSKTTLGKLELPQRHFPSLPGDQESDEAGETASKYEASISDAESNYEPRRTKKKSALLRFSSSFQKRAKCPDVDNSTANMPAIANQERTADVATGLSGTTRGPKWYHRLVPGKRLSRVGPSQLGLSLEKVPTSKPIWMPSLVPKALRKATML